MLCLIRHASFILIVGLHLQRRICEQANIDGRKIVAHRGLEPATFGFQAERAPYWAMSGYIFSGI